jgi:hypothetical protein
MTILKATFTVFVAVTGVTAQTDSAASVTFKMLLDGPGKSDNPLATYHYDQAKAQFLDNLGHPYTTPTLDPKTGRFIDSSGRVIISTARKLFDMSKDHAKAALASMIIRYEQRSKADLASNALPQPDGAFTGDLRSVVIGMRLEMEAVLKEFPDAVPPELLRAAALKIGLNEALAEALDEMKSKGHDPSLLRSFESDASPILAKLQMPDAPNNSTQQALPPQPAPLVTARFVRLGNDYYTNLTNRSSLPITAYSVLVVMYGSGRILRHYYYPGVPGYAPVKPGATKQEGRRGIVVDTQFLAAIFSDGSTFGDSKEVDVLREKIQSTSNSPATPSTPVATQTAHPIIPLREGYYVANGVSTEVWPDDSQRLLFVSIKGDEISITSIQRTRRPGSRGRPSPDANLQLPIQGVVYHGHYTSNPFKGDGAHPMNSSPMTVLSPNQFLVGPEGISSAVFNRLSDAVQRVP